MYNKWKEFLIKLIANNIEHTSENMYVIEDCYNAGMSQDDLKELGFDWLFDEEEN